MKKDTTWKQCGRKIRYKTESDVRRALKQCEKARHVKLDFYECGICNGWHLTSRLEYYGAEIDNT